MQKVVQLPLQMRTFTKVNLTPGEDFNYYRRTTPIRAKRIYEPFQAISKEGVTYSDDGWLVIDEDGHPYCISNENFEKNFEPIGG
jgi:hypothetical protein